MIISLFNLPFAKKPTSYLCSVSRPLSMQLKLLSMISICFAYCQLSTACFELCDEFHVLLCFNLIRMFMYLCRDISSNLRIANSYDNNQIYIQHTHTHIIYDVHFVTRHNKNARLFVVVRDGYYCYMADSVPLHLLRNASTSHRVHGHFESLKTT